MKKKLLSMITCVMITAVMITTSINANALSAGATYTAYEIISMIFAVVGGTTIERQQGIIGGGQFDANALYETMNAQSPGIGSLLSSYVNRAQYLSPGSDLLISENDYQEFLQYFHDYNLQSNSSGEIDANNQTEFLNQVSQFSGIPVAQLTLNQTMIQKINSGAWKYVLTATHEDGGWVLMYGGDFQAIQWTDDDEYLIKFSANYGFFSEYYGSTTDQASSFGTVVKKDTFKYMQIIGGTGYKADPLTNGKIKNGTYDTISKSRTWDATQGKLKGPVTLTMPATSTLSDVLERENVKDITDAVNVYPTDTADDSMIYYPTQSVPDFIVPSITVNPSIAFPGIDGGISDYTIELRNFFPFCIPWDIYDMLSAFVTTPATPEFTFQFPTGVINHQIQWTECTFDLHAWDGVAQGLRTLELIAFAVGLALMTRNIFLRG